MRELGRAQIQWSATLEQYEGLLMLLGLFSVKTSSFKLLKALSISLMLFSTLITYFDTMDGI